MHPLAAVVPVLALHRQHDPDLRLSRSVILLSLNGLELSLIIVFPRSFLSAVSTDIVEFRDQKLLYFPGNYEDYLIHKQEMVRAMPARVLSL